MIDKKSKPIVFFDGVCNLCNWFINTLMGLDKKDRFYVASLQGKTADDFLTTELPDSVVLYYHGKVYHESDAVLKIFQILGGGWRLMSIFYILPSKLRDLLYRYIAKNRYRWFGKKETCRLPTEEEKAKFLE